MTVQGRGKPRGKRDICVYSHAWLQELYIWKQNFVAANKELCEIICKDPEVQANTTSKGIKWTFNPPYASTLWRGFRDHD